jgi:prevent-host-death family protein
MSRETFMPRIGLRQLKTHASEVLRDVQDHRARYVVTNRGEPVAVIIPYAPTEAANTEPFSAVDLMREQRR